MDGSGVSMRTQRWYLNRTDNITMRDSRSSHRLRAESILATALSCLLCTLSASPPSLCPHLVWSPTPPIRHVRRHILPDLRVLRALADQIECTLRPDAHCRLLAFPASGTFTLPLLPQRNTKDAHLLLMQLTRRESEFPWHGHH